MKQITYLLLSLALLSSCGGGKPAQQEEKQEEKLARLKKERGELDQKISKLEAGKKDSVKATPVSVTTVQRTHFNATVDVQSQVSGDENINALPQSPAPAAVTGILVHVGQRVSKGQVLATTDASAIDQQLSGQAVQLTLVKTLYEKQKMLWAQDIGTEVQLLQAKANYESTLKQRDALVAQRNTYRIISPITGTVDQVNLKVGDLVSAQSGASPNVGIHVTNNDKLKAEANLGENYLGKIRQGDPVTLLFPDINDSIRTQLTYVAQAVDPLSRTFNVQVRLGNNSRLHPNMSCRMKIVNYENANAIVVPVNAIQSTAKGDIVYVAQGNVAKSVPVKQGRNSNGMVEIVSGLQGGEKVITEGYQGLDNGSAVAVQ